jgi:D-erythronate 2-dehydrogenase
MHVLMTGASGMLGRKLTDQLVRDGRIGTQAISELTLIDIAAPQLPISAFAGKVIGKSADISAQETAARLVAERPDIIFHLAAVVSGEAEADFDKGYRVNLDGTRSLFEAIRVNSMRDHYCPRVVFASSIAVFGAPLPDVIDDEFFTTPLTSYGAQKAAGELLLSDYTRRGFMDGIAIRLPTICIRPGAPNRAASGFFSSILREPLAGKEAILPVGDDTRAWLASPRVAIDLLIHAATIDLASLGWRRALNMPGISITVAEQLEALQRVAGSKILQLVRREPDAAIKNVVETWPRAFAPRRALSLGFKADASFDDIIRMHIEDESESRRS